MSAVWAPGRHRRGEDSEDRGDERVGGRPRQRCRRGFIPRGISPVIVGGPPRIWVTTRWVRGPCAATLPRVTSSPRQEIHVSPTYPHGRTARRRCTRRAAGRGQRLGQLYLRSVGAHD